MKRGRRVKQKRITKKNYKIRTKQKESKNWPLGKNLKLLVS